MIEEASRKISNCSLCRCVLAVHGEGCGKLRWLRDRQWFLMREER
jgi:hypothetical protein